VGLCKDAELSQTYYIVGMQNPMKIRDLNHGPWAISDIGLSKNMGDHIIWPYSCHMDGNKMMHVLHHGI